MQGTMTKEIEGQQHKDWYKQIKGYKEIDGQGYLDIGGSAVYLEYSRTQIGKALDAYEAEVGHDVRIPDGRNVYVSIADLDKILITRKQFTARRRGLIKD